MMNNIEIIHRYGKYRLVDKGLLGYKIEEFLPAIGEWFEHSGSASRLTVVQIYLNYILRDYGAEMYNRAKEEIPFRRSSKSTITTIPQDFGLWDDMETGILDDDEEDF